MPDVSAVWWKHRINVQLFWKYPQQNMERDERGSLTQHWYRLHIFRHE